MRRTRRTCPATARGSARTAARSGARPRRSRRRGGRCSTPAAASSTPTRPTSCGRSPRLTGAPVTTTLMALGAYPADGPQYLGMLGMHGTKVANWAMDEADLIVAIGARFDDRVTGAVDEFARNAKIVHIDVDPSEIGKIVDVHVPVVGDAKLALRRAVRRLRAPGRRRRRGSPAGGAGSAAGRTRTRCASPSQPSPGCVAPEAALDSLADVLGDAIVTTDVGQHQMWAAGRLRLRRAAPLDHERRPRHDGLRPAGRARRPGRERPTQTVVCVSGEGSFLMNVQELATAVEEQLPVKVLLLDNASLGMVRQQQDLFWGGRRTAVDLGASPDWELLSRAFGWSARSIGEPRRGRGRPRRDAGRARPRAAARPHRARGQLPADVQAGRRGARDDRLTSEDLPGLSPASRRSRDRGGDEVDLVVGQRAGVEQQAVVLDPAEHRRVAGAQRRGERSVGERDDRAGQLEQRQRAAADPRDALDHLAADRGREPRRRAPRAPRASRAASPAPGSPPARRGAAAASPRARPARACRSAAPARADAAAPPRPPPRGRRAGPPAARRAACRRRSRRAPRRRAPSGRTVGSSSSCVQRARADVVDHRHAELAQRLDGDVLDEPELAEVRLVHAQHRARVRASARAS